jgi:hypothetical protein
MLRNPRTLNAAFFNAIFISLLILALFYKVGDYDRASTYKQAVQNWTGLSIMMANNLMFPA